MATLPRSSCSERSSADAIIDLIASVPRGDPSPAVVQPRSDLIAIGIGVAAFAVFGYWLHGWLFGVSPFA